MENEITKDEIVDKIIDIFVEMIGFIDKKEVHPHPIPRLDFKIDSDDLSFSSWRSRSTLICNLLKKIGISLVPLSKLQISWH